MATVNFTKPVTSDPRADVLAYIRDAINSQARLFDGDTLVSPPLNAVRYNSANKELERWNGTSWAELPFQFLRHSNDVLHLVSNSIYATGGTLGSGYGDVWTVGQFRVFDNNVTRLEIAAWRRNAGTDHNTSETRVQRIVDATRMGYVGFNTDGSRRIVLGDTQYGDGPFGEFYRIQADAMMISEHTSAGFQLAPKAAQVGAEWAKWHGLAFIPRTDSGGWARGIQVRRLSDAAFIAGIGYLGTNEAVDAIRLGFGASWWAGNHSNPGLSIGSTGSVALRGSGAELALYSRIDGSTYMSWYCPAPGQMFLYNNANNNNRWEFDQNNIYHRAQDNLTHWFCPSDNLSLGIHVNYDLAYFMRSTTNGGTSWGTVPDGAGVGRYPMILNLSTGGLAVAQTIEAHGGIYSYNTTSLFFKSTGLTDYTDGCLELRTVAGDVGIGFHNGGANAGSLIYSRANNRFEFKGNPISGNSSVVMADLQLTSLSPLISAGAHNSYGGVTIRGDRNGYGGISFQQAGGGYLFTLMCLTDRSYFGIYDETRGVWPIYTSAFTSTTKIWYFEGGISASQNVYAYSDGRLKKNVVTLRNALSKVRRMRGVSYERTDTETVGVGVIAQEMQVVEPRVVGETDKGTLTVDYGSLGAYFIEAIKELAARLDRLEGMNEDS